MAPTKRGGKAPRQCPIHRFSGQPFRTAELQTARDARGRAQCAEDVAQQAFKFLRSSPFATQLETLREQAHNQAMEIQGSEHRADPRSQDLRRLLADQAMEIRD
ncbi:hypothetical protein PInf_002659 [Phytophthora infestans]|nr:hypothetical protein PInf_002659 [Phytophthora infestans]